MKKILTLLIVFVLLTMEIAYSENLTKEEIEKLIEENPELKAILKEHPELEKLIEEHPEIVEEKLKEFKEKGLTEIVPEKKEEISKLFLSKIKEFKDEANKKIEELPWIGRVLIGDERINFYIDNISTGIELEDGFIKDIGEKFEKPTLIIRIPEKAIIEFATKEDIEILKKNIEVEAVRFWTKIKMFFMKIGFKLFIRFSK